MPASGKRHSGSPVQGASLAAGDKPPTIVEVAELAQVSIGSVSRVLNRHPSVKKSTHLKVMWAIEQLGFKPNLAAQNIRSRLSRTVTCILRDIEIAGFGRFVSAADEVFVEAGYALMLCNTKGDLARERDLIDFAASRRSDAILIAHSTEKDEALHRLMEQTQVPMVLVDREAPAWADSVVIDHGSAVRAATRALIELGHQRIALLTGSTDLYPARDRLLGFQQAHYEMGLPFDPALCCHGDFEARFAREQTLRMARLPRRPTAVIAGGIQMLPGVLRALQELGLSIPEQMSVVGALSTDLTELHTPAIAVEAWDYTEMGRQAARLALDRLGGTHEGSPRRVVLPSQFLMKASIGPATVKRRGKTGVAT